MSAVAGGLGAYRFIARYRGGSAGVLSAVLYVSSPYPFLANLLARGAMAESVALGTLPWLLYFTTQLIHSERFHRRYFVLSTITASIVLLTHNISSLMYVFLSVLLLFIYIILFSRGMRRAALLLVSCLGIFVLSLLVSSFYLFDTLIWLSHVQNDLASSSFHSEYHRFFRPQSPFMNSIADMFKFQPRHIYDSLLKDRAVEFSGVIFVATMISVVISRIIYRSNENIISLQFIFVAIILFIIFMNTSMSERVWNSLSFVKFVQFPWRLHGIAYLLSAFTISLAWPGTPPSLASSPYSWGFPLKMIMKGFLIVVILIVVFQSIIDSPGTLNESTPFTWNGKDLLSATESNRYGSGTTSGGEFLPKTAAWDIQTSPTLRRGIRVLDEEFPQSGWVAGIFRVLSGSAIFHSATFSDGDISFGVDCHEPTEIAIHQVYFPLWSAKMDSIPVQISTIGIQPRRNLNFGIMTVPCPAGYHFFELRVSSNIYSIVASLVSMFLVFVITYVDYVRIIINNMKYHYLIVILIVSVLFVAVTVFSVNMGTSENRLVRDIFSDVSQGKVRVSTPAGRSWGFQSPFVESRSLTLVYGSESRIDRRRWIYSHPKTDLEIYHRVGKDEMFHGSCAMDPSVVSQPVGDGVDFRVSVAVGGDAYEELYHLLLNPRADPGTMRWHDFWIDLGKYSGKDIIIRLSTDYHDDSRNDWAGWGAPEIVRWPDPREDPGAIHPWFAPSLVGIAAPPSTWRRD